MSVDGKFFRLGEKKFYAKGVGYGPFAPSASGDKSGFPAPEQAARDFAQIRELGANLVRGLLERGERPHLAALPEPGQSFASVEQVFVKALEHEQKVTAAINRLYEMASAEKDYACLPLLQWFVTEQVEEESNVGRVLERVRLASAHPAALLVLDRELGARQGD